MNTAATTAATPSGPWTAVGPADAPAIVFVHGTRLTRAAWWPQLRRLSGRYRCVALDLPGHGALAGEPFTLDGAADRVGEAIAAAVPSGRAVVVGLSLGGYVAVEAAGRHPDRVAGLVLAGCSADPVGAMAGPFRGLARILEIAPRGPLDALNAAFFRLRYGAPVGDPIVAGGFWSDGGAAAVRSLVGIRFRERLFDLWVPVLVLNGALDPVFHPGGVEWAASARRGRHVVIPRAMHLSNLDRPGAFAEAVARFTDEVSPQP